MKFKKEVCADAFNVDLCCGKNNNVYVKVGCMYEDW